MASGIKLFDLRLMLKAEIGNSLDVGTSTDDELDLLLKNKQTLLAAQYDWDSLKTYLDFGAVASTRYYALPDLNYNRPVSVEVKWTMIWQPVEYGIDVQEMNYIDSDRGMMMDPVQRWQRAPQSGVDQIELWPIPASNSTVRFIGQQPVRQLITSEDTCTLDGYMLVLYCAAEKLARYKQEDAQAKLVAANGIAASLRSSNERRTKVFNLNGVSDTRRLRRTVPIILTHG